jgi:hypothetical protein
MPLQQVHPESVMDKKALERTTEMRRHSPLTSVRPWCSS